MSRLLSRLDHMVVRAFLRYWRWRANSIEPVRYHLPTVFVPIYWGDSGPHPTDLKERFH